MTISQSNSKNTFKAIIVLFFVFFLFSFNLCKSRPEDRPNILLIVPDALRAKQLPLYGYDNIKTPNIDRLAEESVIFKHALVRIPVTQPSFSNLFSGLMLPMNCLRWNEKSLAQYLKEERYKTVGIIGSRVLSTWAPDWKGKKQFDRGFDEYIQDEVLFRKPYTRRNAEITNDILKWLEDYRLKNSQRPFFLFAHYIDPHAPYDPDYNGEILKIDKELGRITEKLKELNLYNNSLIVFTSDHGESLGHPIEDHGSFYGHGWFTYLEQIQVPLIMKFPQQRHVKSIEQIVRNYDILPTILDIIGVKFDRKKLDGVSLLPAIKKDRDLQLISYHVASSTRLCPSGTISVVFKFNDGYFQLIRGAYSEKPLELYHISSDSFEQHNLAYRQEYGDIVSRGKSLAVEFNQKWKSYKERVNRWLERKKRSTTYPGNMEVNEDLEALKSLGYIKGGAPSQDISFGNFLMRTKLAESATLDYLTIIRQAHWGIKKNDGYFPIKILSGDGEDFYILANHNRELFVYNVKEGFRTLNAENILDMAVDRKNKRILLLKSNAILVLDMKNKNLQSYKKLKGKLFFPAHGLFIDPLSNLYVLRKNHVLKISPKGDLLQEYTLTIPSSSLFTADKAGYIYTAQGGKIFKYNRTGLLISSVRLAEGNETAAALDLDEEGRLWVLNKRSPELFILDREGNRIDSFQYNKHKIGDEKREWQPIPTKYFYLEKRVLFIIDNWEAILVYGIS